MAELYVQNKSETNHHTSDHTDRSSTSEADDDGEVGKQGS